jgi:hypothetical protein
MRGRRPEWVTPGPTNMSSSVAAFIESSHSATFVGCRDIDNPRCRLVSMELADATVGVNRGARRDAAIWPLAIQHTQRGTVAAGDPRQGSGKLLAGGFWFHRCGRSGRWLMKI